MCDKFEVTIPLPPSVNHYYFTAKNGKRIMTNEAKIWMYEAQYIILSTLRKQSWQFNDKDTLVMELYFFFPDNRRRDTHNMHKALCDAPEGILYKDDKQVLVRDMSRGVDKQESRVEMVIYPICEE